MGTGPGAPGGVPAPLNQRTRAPHGVCVPPRSCRAYVTLTKAWPGPRHGNPQSLNAQPGDGSWGQAGKMSEPQGDQVAPCPVLSLLPLPTGTPPRTLMLTVRKSFPEPGWAGVHCAGTFHLVPPEPSGVPHNGRVCGGTHCTGYPQSSCPPGTSEGDLLEKDLCRCNQRKDLKVETADEGGP